MSVTENVSAAGLARQSGFLAELRARTRGPGGLYNAGNLLGLCTAVGLQFATAGSAADGAGTLLSYFAGSPQALAFSIATVVFLFSGEIYHRAWQGRQSPDRRLNRLGDLLSAIGGAALATSLLLLGQPVLALVTGVLIVLGKLGSAAFGDDAVAPPAWPDTWPDPFRLVVLVGRAPAVAAAALDLVQQTGSGSPWLAMVQPAVLIACHVLWIKADLLLLDGGRKLAAARPAAS